MNDRATLKQNSYITTRNTRTALLRDTSKFVVHDMGSMTALQKLMLTVKGNRVFVNDVDTAYIPVRKGLSAYSRNVSGVNSSPQDKQFSYIMNRESNGSADSTTKDAMTINVIFTVQQEYPKGYYYLYTSQGIMLQNVSQDYILSLSRLSLKEKQELISILPLSTK